MRSWKRRLILMACGSLVILAGCVLLAFSRFHFSSQMMWPLSQMQWNDGSEIEIEGAYPLVIGHRGSGIPSLVEDTTIGNTASAIDGAVRYADWIEIDVRASGDDQPVLVAFHDETIDRKTSGSGAVSELTLQELQAVTLNVPNQERILTLEEMLTQFHLKNDQWILDIKATGIRDLVMGFAERKIAAGQLRTEGLILFGEFDVLAEYRDSRYAKGYTLLWGEPGNRFLVLFRQQEIINRCQELGCDYLILPVIFANRKLVDFARSNGLEVWVYGVKEKQDFNFLANAGVTGFIVDRPRHFSQVADNSQTDREVQAPAQNK